MTELQHRISTLRQRARQAVWLHGVSWLVAGLLGGALLLGSLDWAVHLDNAAARVLLAATALIGLGVLAWRMLVAPLSRQLSDIAVALKIERRYPALRDSLASTVQFSESQRDARLGSPELQQQVIEQTESQFRNLDLDDVIETRDVRLASFAAIGVCLLVALIAGLRPADASIALQRMVFPFAAAEWPRKVHLQLRDADLKRMPLDAGEPFGRVEGDNFKLYVENVKGPLPDDVALHLRYGDGETDSELLRKVTIRDKQGRTRTFCVANILVEDGPIRFRVTGGDDDVMPEQTLNVVPAPRIESLQVALLPPAYLFPPGKTDAKTAESRRIRLPKNVGHFEALVGTEVRVEGVANKPLQSASSVLRVRNEPPRNLAFEKDGRRFTATFLVRESGSYSYWFDLTDRDGYTNPSAPRYDVRAATDRVPIVRLLEPAGDLAVTANAVVDVKYNVEDDLRIRSVALRHRVGRDKDGPLETIPLFDRPLTRPIPPNAADGTAPPTDRERKGDYEWRIPDLPPRTTIHFYVEAEDDFNLDAEARPDRSGKSQHVGESLTRTITIVSRTEKAAEIARRYGELLDDLGRLERRQQEAQGQVDQLRIQLEQAGRLQPNDLMLLKRVARDQRELADQLLEGKQSLKNRAAGLERELQRNQIENRPLERRLKRMIGELDALGVSALKQVQAELRNAETDAERDAGESKSKPSATAAEQSARLNRVSQKQGEILRSLRDLAGELSEWRNWQDLAAEAKGLIQDQDEVHREADRLKGETLGKPSDELTDQQKADLARIGEQQRRIGDRVDQFQEAIGRFLEQLRKEDEPDVAARQVLEDAAGLIRDQTLVERMQNAAGRIERNQLGQTVPQLKKLGDELRELEDVLENRGSDDLETLIRKQRQAEDDLLQLQKEQQEVADRLQQLGDSADDRKERDELQKLLKRQRELERKAAEASRRLRRLSANDSNRSMQRAAENMQRSGDALERNALEQSRIEQREVRDHIEQARRELARNRQRLEAVLAREVLQQLAVEIDGLVRRQENVVDGTSRLHNEFERSRKWTRGRLITLDTLREEQARLQGRVDELAKTTGAAAVFSLALEGASQSMAEAARALISAREDAPLLSTALAHERTAKRQLQDLLKTLKPDDPNENGPQKQDDGAGEEEDGSDSDGPAILAQLKLIKSMQDELAARTRDFDKTRKPRTELTREQQSEIKEFANRQSKLADLLRNLMRDVGVPPEGGPVDEAGEIQPGNKPDPERNPETNKPEAGNQSESASDQKSERGGNEPNDAADENAPRDEAGDEDRQTTQRLQRAARNMQSAAERLGEFQTGETTGELHRQIAKDLEDLVSAAGRLASKQNASSNRQQTADSAGKPKRDQGNEDESDRPDNGKPKTGAGTGSGEPTTGKEKSKDSDSNVRRSPSETQPLTMDRRDRIIQEVWGHLPEHVKKELRNVSGEKYLPKYKPLISKYFESLAE